MTRSRRVLVVAIAGVLSLVLGWVLWQRRTDVAPSPPSRTAATGAGDSGGSAAPAASGKTTTVYAHNLRLRKGPRFRVYVRWIRGELQPTRAGGAPSLDDPESFVLQIQRGLVRVNIGDIANFLNGSAPKDAPLKNISIQPDGELLKLRGTAHKIVPLPVELEGGLMPMPDGRVRFHVSKVNVLKLPMKGLLRGFHLALSDLVRTTDIPGVQVAGDDIFFDTQRLLPPPHIHGAITSVKVAVPDIEVIYGDAPMDEGDLSQWHNFLRIRGGTLDFARLTMQPADLTMIDTSKDAWFDLDLVNYKAQLVNGYLRMTEQGGLEIYMTDPGAGSVQKKLAPGLTVDWLKNRNAAVPAGVPVKETPPEH